MSTHALSPAKDDNSDQVLKRIDKFLKESDAIVTLLKKAVDNDDPGDIGLTTIASARISPFTFFGSNDILVD